jgi:hypothetical protein
MTIQKQTSARARTIAFELVATPMSDGPARLVTEARKLRGAFAEAGLQGKVNTLLLPQLIEEEGDRPVRFVERIDPVDAQQGFVQELPLDFILTQVTVFTPLDELRQRLIRMRAQGVQRVVFVGVPRVFDASSVVGPYPDQALRLFADVMEYRGVVLIPTRPGERARFCAKLDAGANFALSQLLFGDSIVPLLKSLCDQPHRPEILLSFGYVPKLETATGLIRWLIKDTTALAEADMAEVARLAELGFKEKKVRLLELFRRVVGGAVEFGFPLGLHLESPYGASAPALETFAAMVELWEQLTS